MNIIGTLILTTALAGVGGTGLGGLVGAMLQKDSKRTVSLLLSLAGGVMLSVVCFDLVTEAIETNMGIWTVVGAISIGVAVLSFFVGILAKRFLGVDL
jgi:ZIP family zinc transporter